MPQLARAHRIFLQHNGCACAGAFDTARPVVRGGRHHGLDDPVGYANYRPESGDRLLGHDSFLAAVDAQIQCSQPGGDGVEIVGIISADGDFDQSAGRCVDQPQLVAASAGAQPAVGFGGGPEFGVVVTGCARVGYPDGDRGQAVQRHCQLLEIRCAG
jgi:hypothetical protein